MKNKLKREDTPCLPPSPAFWKSCRMKYILNHRTTGQSWLGEPSEIHLVWHLSQGRLFLSKLFCLYQSGQDPVLLQLWYISVGADVSPPHTLAWSDSHEEIIQTGWWDRSAAESQGLSAPITAFDVLVTLKTGGAQKLSAALFLSAWAGGANPAGVCCSPCCSPWSPCSTWARGWAGTGDTRLWQSLAVLSGKNKNNTNRT